MNKIKFLSIVIMGLLASNLLLIGAFLLHSDEGKRGGPKKQIIEKLHFDEAQIQQYEKLITWHEYHSKNTHFQIIDLKKQLYTTLTNDKDNLKKETLLIKIAALEIELERINYQHFKDIKKICRKDQQKYYKHFSQELTNLFNGKNK
jgi:hypothetical protein